MKGGGKKKEEEEKGGREKGRGEVGEASGDTEVRYRVCNEDGRKRDGLPVTCTRHPDSSPLDANDP